MKNTRNPFLLFLCLSFNNSERNPSDTNAFLQTRRLPATHFMRNNKTSVLSFAWSDDFMVVEEVSSHCRLRLGSPLKARLDKNVGKKMLYSCIG